MFRYIVGTAALTVAIQIVYDLAKEPIGLGGGIILAAVLILLMTIVVWVDVQHANAVVVLRPTETPMNPQRGLILLVSPGKLDVPLSAVRHHKARLERCWLLATSKSLPAAQQLKDVIYQNWPAIQVHDPVELLVDPESLASTWGAVERIYSRLAPAAGLAENEIVADITGGQKPMTAGMTLACSSPNRKLQYMKTIRDENGDPQPGVAPQPIQIDLNVPFVIR